MATVQMDLARTAMPFQLRPGQEPTVDYVAAFRDVMVERYQRRNMDFRVLVNAWHGNYYDLYDWLQVMDTAGNPILRDSTGGRNTAIPTTVNIYKGFVDSYKRMLVGLPDIRIPTPPGMFPSDLNGQKAAEAYTERMKQAGYGTWAASNMDIQQINAAWWLTTCGSHGAVVMPDFDRGHSVIRYVAPWNVYGIGKMNDPIALSRCVIVSDEDPLIVGNEFPDVAMSEELIWQNPLTAGQNDPAMTDRATRFIKHIVYMDEHWFVRMLGNKIISKDRHDLGFCPALIPQFIMLPEYRNRGHSVGEQTLPMQLSINYAVSLWEAGMKDSIFKTTWVKDPINVPDNWARGRNQLITLTGDGAIGELGGDTQALNAVAQHVDMMRSMMQLNTGVSQAVLEGTLSGGTVTGRALEKSMSPYLAGVEELQTTQAAFMSRILDYAFRMNSQEDFWDGTKEDTIKFTGVIKHRSVAQEFTREEFKTVPSPEIIFAPMAYMGLPDRVNIALQLFNTKPSLLSWQKIVEMTGLVDDIEELRRQIESDNLWRMQIMEQEVAAQQPKAPTVPGMEGAGMEAAIPSAGAPVGDPAAVAGIAAGGATDPLASVDKIALAQFLKAGPSEVSEPQPIASGLGKSAKPVMDEIAQAIAALDLNGEPLLAGTVVYVDYRDKKKVTDALEHLKVTIKAKGKSTPKGAVPIGVAPAPTA